MTTISHPKLIVANWKANFSEADVKAWWAQMSVYEIPAHREVVVAPPVVHLSLLRDFFSNSEIDLGLQDLSSYPAGAYTGEVPGEILTGYPIKYVILGHSERRKYFGEDNKIVAKKVERALTNGWTPIVCVDRPDFQEQANQLDEDVKAKIIVAYEPVHAISTFGGQEDPLEKTLEAVLVIKEEFGDVPVLYGGSVKAENALTYLSEETISGVLVGGASLKPDVFASIIGAQS